MASEQTNSLVLLHSKLDSLIQAIGSSSDFAEKNEELEEEFVTNIEDSDILLSLKKQFLLGYSCFQKNNIQQGISHFQRSLHLQDELSYETIRVLTLSFLFECFRLANSTIQTFEFACLLENEHTIPQGIRKNVLQSLHSGYVFVGSPKKALDTVLDYLKMDLTPKEKVLAQLAIIQVQNNLENSSKFRIDAFDPIEQLLKDIDYDFDVSMSYLSVLLDLKEYERLKSVASLLKEFYSTQKHPFAAIWYYEAIGNVKSTKNVLTEIERKNIVEQCVREKQYLFAILVNVLFVSESDNVSNNSLEILESCVKLFDDSISTSVQIDVLERLVECCENTKEWKKGLYYFELYHNALQTFANDNNTKTIEKIQLKQFISTLSKQSHSSTVSTEIQQRRNILRQHQQSEFDQFVQSISKYVQSGMHNTLEIVKHLPVKRYSSDIAESIISITRSMISTVETVIELHSLEDGTYNGSYETIHLISIIEKLESQLQLLTNQYDCSIQVFIDKQIQWYGDTQLLSKTLLHILQNACKFSLKHSTIIVNASMTTNEILISISDSGVGVSEEHLALVFSKYFQYDPLSTNYKSAGLGLPYCKKAISYLQGNIQLHSKVDVGTEVIVSLPISSSKGIPVTTTATYSFEPFDSSLSESDCNELRTVISKDSKTMNFSHIISTIDTIEGSKELQNWKRKLYLSLLIGEKEKVQTMIAQIH